MVRQVWFVLLTALLAVWVLYRLVKCSVSLLTHKMKMIVLTTWYGHTDIESISDLSISYPFLFFDL